MEEKQMMTNEQLESELQSLRSKATIAKALTYGSGAAMVLCFITALIPLAIVFIVIALVGGYLLEKNSSKLKKLLSDNVISGVIKRRWVMLWNITPGAKSIPAAWCFRSPITARMAAIISRQSTMG